MTRRQMALQHLVSTHIFFYITKKFKTLYLNCYCPFWAQLRPAWPGRPRTSYLAYIRHLLGYEEGIMQVVQKAMLAKNGNAWRSLVVTCSAVEGWWCRPVFAFQLPKLLSGDDKGKKNSILLPTQILWFQATIAPFRWWQGKKTLFFYQPRFCGFGILFLFNFANQNL